MVRILFFLRDTKRDSLNELVKHDENGQIFSTSGELAKQMFVSIKKIIFFVDIGKGTFKRVSKRENEVGTV
jgi:hypothetical protein